MKRLFGPVAAAGLLIPNLAWAQQPPGWQICWGNGCNVPVPLDPWMVVATGVLLLLAGLAALRRHARGGLFLLAGALAVSAVAVHDARLAYAIPADFIVSGPSGNQTVSCPLVAGSASTGRVQGQGIATPTLSVLNSSGSAVKLFLTPVNGANIGWLSGVIGACQQGGTLNSGASCLLPCGASPT